MNLLKYLGEDRGERGEGGCLPPLIPAVWTAAPTSSWDACGGKTLSSSKDTCFPLCRRCRTASSSASKVTALAASGPSPSSFVMGRTRPKTRMFPWRGEAGIQPSNTRWAEASCSQPNHLMGMLPCPSCPTSGTPHPAHLSAAPAHCDTSCGAAAPAGTCAAAPGWCCAPPRWPG